MNKSEGELTMVDIRAAMLKVFIILADANSLCNLKKRAPLMKTWNFPKEEDEETVSTLIKSFPNGMQQVRSMGVSYMRFVASREIQSYASVKATQEVFKQIQDVVLPQMRSAAKAAFKSKAHDYLESQRASIIATAFIPIVGQEKAREELADAKKEAIKRGNEAAKKAAEAKKTELMPQIDAKARELTRLEVGANKAAIKQLIILAVKDAKKRLLQRS